MYYNQDYFTTCMTLFHGRRNRPSATSRTP